jgi:hypothetical protein
MTMTLELVNTLATCATLVVVATAAIAAIVQLRHLRASNQIVAFNELRQAFESSHLAAAHKYVDTHLRHDLEDPAFRYAIAHRLARTEETHALVKHLLNFAGFFETMGLLVKSGLVPSELVLGSWSEVILASWEIYAPVTAIFREYQAPTSYEHFEYLTVLAQRWRQKHTGGNYPANMPRLPIEYRWTNADREYESTLKS